MLFKSKLIECRIVKGAKLRGQAAQCPDKSDLRTDVINDETKPKIWRKRETFLGFTLHFNERISRREKIRDQMVTAIGRKGKVADFVRGIEGPTHQVAAGLNMPRPGYDHISEAQVRSSLETLQPAFFDQVIAKLAETEACLVIVEPRSRYHGKPYIGEA